jgi:hypothetical protein
MWLALGKTTQGISYPTGQGSGTYYTTITASASTNTKGSYSELYPSVPFDSYMAIHVCRTPSTGFFLFDVALGASSSEVVIWENLCHNVQAASGGYDVMYDTVWSFPTVIPKGTRVSARCQQYSGGGSIQVKVQLYPVALGTLSYPAGVITLGADTSDSAGTTSAPSVINTYGAWVALSASTPHPFKGFRLGFTTAGANTGLSNYWYKVDFGIGAAGSEQVIIKAFRVVSDGTYETQFPRMTPIYPIAIPEATRIAVRSMCINDTPVDDDLDVIFYGIT